MIQKPTELVAVVKLVVANGGEPRAPRKHARVRVHVPVVAWCIWFYKGEINAACKGANAEVRLKGTGRETIDPSWKN